MSERAIDHAPEADADYAAPAPDAPAPQDAACEVCGTALRSPAAAGTAQPVGESGVSVLGVAFAQDDVRLCERAGRGDRLNLFDGSRARANALALRLHALLTHPDPAASPSPGERTPEQDAATT